MPIILEKESESTIFEEKQNLLVSKINSSILGENWRKSSHYACGENDFKMVQCEKYIYFLFM